MAKIDDKAEIERLRARLQEAEETLEAIHGGEVDALMVTGPNGEQVYTLRDADRPYRLLLQEMNEGAATLMPDGTVLYCNQRFAGMLKTSSEKVIGFPMKNFVESSDQPLLEALLRSGNKGRVKVEITFAADDGRPVPVYCSINPVDIGALPCLCLVATDLTEQKRNEKTMAAEKLARQILECAADIIVVCDERGVIIQASRAAHELTGTNVLHRTFDEVFPLSKNGAPIGCAVEETGAENGSFTTRCLEGQTVQSLEVQFEGRDGKKFDLLMSAGPLRDSQEQALGCVFTLTDVSRLKEAEEIHALLAAIVESSDDAIISKTLDGIITSWNGGAERLFGYAAHEAVGQSIMIIIRPESYAEEQSILKRIRRGESIAHYETVRVAKDGRELDISLTVSPIRNSAGVIVGASKVARDITMRRRMDEMLRENEQKLRQKAEELEQQLIASGRLVSLGELTASMAHEFNNPLGIIMGFAQELLSETEPSSPDHQALKIIYTQTKRCEKIIKDLLQFARPHAADLGPTRVRELIEETVQLVNNHLYKQKIEARIQTDEDLPEIHADRQQLQQVLVNLYLNAIDAMPEGGNLTVTAARAGGYSSEIVISVSDSGFGIAPDDLPKIFQPFFTAKKKSGLGLGLSICNRIIKHHGGRIEAESRPHQGTTFKIYLPLERKATIDEKTEAKGREEPCR
ncbi:MAG TPA: PAS domain S-box protein [Candidatus Binatia bacterium]